jgi:hypothetical protein
LRICISLVMITNWAKLYANSGPKSEIEHYVVGSRPE